MSLQTLLDQLNTAVCPQVELPLTHLCGIAVSIRLQRSGPNYDTTFIHILIHGDDTKDLAPYLQEPLTLEGLERIVAQLDTFKYSKKRDEFYQGDLPPSFEDLFKGTNYTLVYGDCVGCHETTRRRTPMCHHHLCRECEATLERHKCPLCLKRIVWVDSDDEGDY